MSQMRYQNCSISVSYTHLFADGVAEINQRNRRKRRFVETEFDQAVQNGKPEDLFADIDG